MMTDIKSVSKSQEDLDVEISRILDERGGNLEEDRFNRLALELFRSQFESNNIYRRFCLEGNLTPENVSDWRSIPAIPTAAFKHASVSCFPSEKAVKSFTSSGTSDSERKGTYYLDERGVKIYDKAVIRGYEEFMVPDRKVMQILALSPSPEFLPNMSMANAIQLWVNCYGRENSTFLIGKDGLNTKAFITALKQAEETGDPVSIIGATFGFVHFLDACAARDMNFQLPEGSRTIDGGGYKGRSREVPKTEFFSQLSETLGISKDHCINLLGMTERASQFYDNVLRNAYFGIEEPRYKPDSPWTRTVVVDPEDFNRILEPDSPMEGWPGCFKSETGLLRHYDLANVSTVLGVQTDDIGYSIKTAYGTGFEILGRANGAEARGCSLAIEELMGEAKNGGS